MLSIQTSIHAWSSMMLQTIKAKINNMLKSLFSILIIFYSIQASALPPEIKKDQYMSKLAKLLKEKKYTEAAPYPEKLDALASKYGIKLPNSYYYFKGEILHHNWNHENAKNSLEKYFSITSNKGRYYTEAISLYDDIETILSKSYFCTVFVRKDRKKYYADVPVVSETKIKVNNALESKLGSQLEKLTCQSISGLYGCQSMECYMYNGETISMGRRIPFNQNIRFVCDRNQQCKAEQR